MPLVPHDPQARLDYRWDWTAWLAEGDTISSATVTTAADGVSITDVDWDDASVVAWVSGGTTGTSVGLVCHVTTVGGRQDERTQSLAVRQR